MTKTENSKSTKATKTTSSKKEEEQLAATLVVVEEKKSKKTSKKEETTTQATVAPVEEKKTKKSSKKEDAPVATPVEEKKGKKSAKKEEVSVAAPVEEKKTKKSAKKEEVSVAQVTQEVDQTGGKKRKRYFRCVYKSKAGEIVHAGRYSGKKPKQAARKALTRIADKNELNIGESVTFLIQECTRGSRKKKYSYSGSRVNLTEPVTVNIAKKDKDGNKTGEFSSLTYTRDNVVKKISLDECKELATLDLGEDVDEVEEPVVKVKKTTKKVSKKLSKKASTKTPKVEEKVEVKVEPKVEAKTEAKKAKSKSK